MGGLLELPAVAVLHENGAQAHEAGHGDDEEHDQLHDEVGAEQARDERDERAHDEPHGDKAERDDSTTPMTAATPSQTKGLMATPFSLLEYTMSSVPPRWRQAE